MMDLNIERNVLPFSILNAFSSSVFGGNPAAIIFLPHGLPAEILHKVAQNLSQPMHTFVFPLIDPGADSDVTEVNSILFNIRWFTTEVEISICGHGTLAAAKALFSKQDIIAKGIETIKFQTIKSGVMAARKVDESWIEIELPSTRVLELLGEERARIRTVVEKAFKKDVNIKLIGRGGAGFEHYLFVVLDETEDLEKYKVNTAALTETEPFLINVVTTASRDLNAAFISRMFAPRAGVQEDHVCGSAHCLLGPYWSQKHGLGGNEMCAKQVSARGGDLKVVWDEEKNLIRLRGEVKLIATGEVYID